MTKKLRGKEHLLTALAEDPHSVPSTHVRQLVHNQGWGDGLVSNTFAKQA